ncbi:hypothetical protein D3C78_1107160 [compost metagenome]
MAILVRGGLPVGQQLAQAAIVDPLLHHPARQQQEPASRLGRAEQGRAADGGEIALHRDLAPLSPAPEIPMLALTALAADEAVVTGQLIGMDGLAMLRQVGGGGDQQGLVRQQVAGMQAAVGRAPDANGHVHVVGIEIHQPVVELDLDPDPGVAG